MAVKLTSLTKKNNDTIANSGRELYPLQFLLQVAGQEIFGYIIVMYEN
jgi:hypothetical protein